MRYSHRILFFSYEVDVRLNLRYVDGSYILLKMKKAFLDKGIFKKVGVNEKPDYYFPSGSDFFSAASNLIPGISGVSGGRVLLGDKAAIQAISLVNRETPLVQSAPDKDNQSFEEHFGKTIAGVNAKNSGVVSQVDENGVTITDKDGSEVIHPLYQNFNSGRKSFLHQSPAVQVGDKVKKGDVVATSNYTDSKGNLALGVNLITAVMPYRSANFEDAFVVTESGAKKLEAEQLLTIRIEKRMGIETNKDKYISLFPGKFYSDQLVHLDGDGVVKKGTILKYGDPVILAFAPKTLKTSDMYLGKLSRALGQAYKDMTETWSLEHEGEVVDVAKTAGLFSVNIKTKRGMAVGDKLCLSPDHEVLTTNGWVESAQLSVEDEICTLNPDTENIEYINAEEILEFNHEGSMYQLETTQISMCVTDNHKLYARKRGYKNYELIEAKNLFGKRYHLKRNGNWNGESPESYHVGDKEYSVKDYLTIVGMFISEGNLFCHVKSGSYGFEISQSKQPNRQQLEEKLNELNINFCNVRRGVRIYSKAWYEELQKYGKICYSKQLTPELLFHNRDDLKVLYEWLMWGDGCEKGTGHSYCTTSKQLASDVQHLCLHIGLSANIKTTPGGYLVLNPQGNYSVAATRYDVYIYRHKNHPTINHGHTKSQNGQREEWVSYKGKVFCVTFLKIIYFTYVEMESAIGQAIPWPTAQRE